MKNIKSFALFFLLCLVFIHPLRLSAKPNKLKESAYKKTFLFVNHPDHPTYYLGMFSVFCYVAGVLYEYEQHEYAGIKVDFENHGLYHDTLYGSNWWNYYCEPLHISAKKKNVIYQDFDIHEYSDFAFFAELKLSRQDINKLIKKYIHVKQSILKKVDDFQENNFHSLFTLAVHYRGTDKSSESPRITYENVVETVNSFLNTKNIQDFKIFVASDEQAFIHFMLKTYPGQIIMSDAVRSTSGVPIHLTNNESNYLIGEQALIDCLLLSRANCLIRTSSNLSLWSTYFNESMPVIELTGRY